MVFSFFHRPLRFVIRTFIKPEALEAVVDVDLSNRVAQRQPFVRFERDTAITPEVAAKDTHAVGHRVAFLQAPDYPFAVKSLSHGSLLSSIRGSVPLSHPSLPCTN